MIIKHFFIFLVLMFSSVERTFSQNEVKTAPCLGDSTEYKAMTLYLDTLNHHGGEFNSRVLFYWFLKDEKRDAFCSMLLFAKVFDFLLKDGLDLRYDPVKEQPIHISGASMGFKKEDDPVEKERVIQNARFKKYRKYLDFLEVKSEYELQVINQYAKEDNRSLIQDVSSLIHFGAYGNPLQLRDILMSKYADINKEKIFEAKKKSRRFK